ncbi:MAG: TVP38/TMEM64 family protein [Candidatus Dojkabacteria bacterium]
MSASLSEEPLYKEIWRTIKVNKKVFYFGVTLLFFYLGLLFFFRVNSISREVVEDFLSPLGGWGIFMAFAIQVLTSLTPLPDAPLAFVTMILYGPVVGSITIMSGMTTATILNYFIARKLGRKFIFERFPVAEQYLRKFGKKITFEVLLLLRVFSFVTFDVVSYIASLSHVNFWKFLLSSVVGLVPLVLSHAMVAQGLFTNDPLELLLSLLAPSVITIAIAYLAKISKITVSD